MILIAHVIVALGSLVVGSILLARPSVALLRATYGLTVAALVSGTIMVWQSGAQILQTCVTGLLYVSIVTVVIVLGQRRLAKERVRVHRDR